MKKANKVNYQTEYKKLLAEYRDVYNKMRDNENRVYDLKKQVKDLEQNHERNKRQVLEIEKQLAFNSGMIEVYERFTGHKKPQPTLPQGTCGDPQCDVAGCVKQIQ